MVIFYDWPRAVAVRRVPVITLGSSFLSAPGSLLFADWPNTVWIYRSGYSYQLSHWLSSPVRGRPSGLPE